MAHLAFDAKRAFHNSTGLGNYSRFILNGLVEQFGDKHEYSLMNPKEATLFKERDPRLKEVLPEGIYTILSSLWRSGAMWKELRDNNVDLFHGLSNELPLGLEKQSIRSLVTIHDLIFESHPHFYKPFDRIIYRKKFKSAAQSANRVLSVSTFTKNELIERYGIAEEKIFIHYQSCHPAFQVEGNLFNDRQIASKFKLSENFILSVGTIEERKNLMNILKAIRRTDVPLVVVGRGDEYAKQCREFVSKHRMENRVFWIELISPEDLAAIYRCASLFVYPSRVEGFGIPIIEALFSKTPVITSKGGVFPEAGGPHSKYINPESVEEIESTIAEILDNTILAEKQGILGKKYAEEHFEPSELIRQLDQHYTDLLFE